MGAPFSTILPFVAALFPLTGVFAEKPPPRDGSALNGGAEGGLGGGWRGKQGLERRAR